MSPETVIQRTNTVQFRQLDNEMLAIDAQAGYCYSLNATAIKIWKLLETPTSIANLCAQLNTAYAVDVQTCLNDTLELITSLSEAGLVQVHNGASV